MRPIDLIKIIYYELDARKAESLIVLDMRKVSSIADYFLIASTDSERGVKALVDFVSRKLKEEFNVITKVEGASGGRWIIIDVGDILVHIFHNDTREYFQLESLWSDAQVLKI